MALACHGFDQKTAHLRQYPLPRTRGTNYVDWRYREGLLANYQGYLPRDRSAVLAAARVANPERFSTTTDPKILALPGDVDQ